MPLIAKSFACAYRRAVVLSLSLLVSQPIHTSWYHACFPHISPLAVSPTICLSSILVVCLQPHCSSLLLPPSKRTIRPKYKTLFNCFQSTTVWISTSCSPIHITSAFSRLTRIQCFLKMLMGWTSKVLAKRRLIISGVFILDLQKRYVGNTLYSLEYRPT